MSDLETSGTIEVGVSNRSLKSAKSTIESELGDVSADVTASIANSGGGGQTRGQLAGILDASRKSYDQLTELVELATPRNELLGEILDESERDSGGGSITGMLPSIGLASGISSLAGGLSAGALVSGTVSASALITGTVGAAALIAGNVAIGSYVVGEVSAGNYITGTIAASALIVGNVAIASYISGTLGAGAIIGGTIAASTLIVGAVAAGSLIVGTIAVHELLKGPSDGSGISGSSPGRSETSGSTPAAQNRGAFPGGPPTIDPDDVGAPGERAEDLNASEIPGTSPVASSETSTSSATSASTASGSSDNRARESSQDVRVEHSPTFNVDLSKLERMFDRDLSDLQRQVSDLEDKFKRASRGR